MPFKTNLNVTPYYDDFDKANNFQQILSRPGFAVQARELTQAQSILRNQIEEMGNFLLKEGAMVVPGSIRKAALKYVKLENTYLGSTVDATQYTAGVAADSTGLSFNTGVGTEITGVTSGIKAKVIASIAATATDPVTLLVETISAATDNERQSFLNGEEISANVGITHGTTSYSANAVSAKVITPTVTSTLVDGAIPDFSIIDAARSTGKGLYASIAAGVYYVRGCFVEVTEQLVTVEKYHTPLVNARVGLEVKEEIVTPESDTTLLDNATGTSNYAAKGAHRLKITCTLTSKALTATDDLNFIELMRFKNGVPEKKVDKTSLGRMEKTLARRTFDESGDYTVRPFQFEVKESVELNEFDGVYTVGATTDDGGVAGTDLLAIKVSPGKAYVKGFEVEKIGTTIIDVPKARTVTSVNAESTAYDMGNFVNISNVYGTPDVTFISGETTPYKQVDFLDQPIATRGSTAGTRIGVARTRTIEYSSGTVGSVGAVYKLFLFDIRPFTFITLSGTPSATLEANHSSGGVQVKGVNSGATGWVFADGTGSAEVILTNVAGVFSVGEKITASDSAETDKVVENSSNADLTILRVVTKSVSDVKSVFQVDADSGQNFSADIILSDVTTTESFLNLDSTDTNGGDSGDNIISEIERIPIGLQRAAGGGTGSSIRQAKLQFAEKNVGIFKMSRDVVKTHLTAANFGASDTSYQLRRQFIVTSSSVGVVTMSAGTNEVFLGQSEVDYTISILSAGSGGTGQQGQLVSASTGFSGGGTATVTITNNGVFGNGAKLKIMATLQKSSAAAKTKTVNLMKKLTVVPGATAAYGTRPTDKTISLGRADVFKLVGVFDSELTDTDATVPSLTVGTITGTFTRGEQITGKTSGAKGRIISTSSPIEYVLRRGTTADFQSGETITGFTSGATAVVSAINTGSPNVTERYLLDSGQRDNYYDIARIVLKPGQVSPIGRVLVVYDYMEHGTGDFFTVDSYIDVADQMTYEDIPAYVATKVDPDDPAPSGTFPLQDCFDIRPRAEDIAGTSTNVNSTDTVTGNSFDFVNRQFDGTGSSQVDFLKPSSLITSDFEYFLPYNAKIELNQNGNFELFTGVAAERPEMPAGKDQNMPMLELRIPAFTFKPTHVNVKKFKNQRYTMKDIGKLEARLNHVEFYTSLNMLERDAESFQIQDANGLDRFKSGFVVDNFSGHSVGDAKNPDYKVSMDMSENEMRPICVPKGISLIEQATSDAQRASAGYARTGDLITLPYDEVLYQEQPYKTRVERVTPVLLANWQGRIELSPSGDEWFETETAPDLIVNVEGNFDTFFEANKSQIGTVWNSWQTTWSGVVASSSTTAADRFGHNMVSRTTTTTRSDQTRSGIQTNVIPQIDLESQGTKVIQRAFIPFVRARNVTFEGTGFYPNMRLYAFFDKQDVTTFITPTSGYTTDAADVSGVVRAASPMITDATGEIKGIFAIPDPKVDGNPKFRTGEVEFRLTSSATNVTTKMPATEGQTVYNAVGILETEQETIIATRNARLEIRDVSENQSVTSSSSSSSSVPIVQPDPGDDWDWGDDGGDGDGDGDGGDPIAQTFIIAPGDGHANDGKISLNSNATKRAAPPGRFITSVDLYFTAKDPNLPVWMEIRNTVNGVPGVKTLPFARSVKKPNEINIDSTGATATTFRFPSPVFCQQGVEYAFLVMTNSPEYKVFISRMGETTIDGSRSVSEQPHIGTMFKSHNARTWAPSLTEDISFVMRAAKFETTGGTVTLTNDTLPKKTLANNPIIFDHGNTALRVLHENHHMYSATNNVEISGVVSGASTTLAAALDSTATTFTLVSSTDFDDTSGKFRNNSSSEWFVKIGDEIIKYTAISGATVSSAVRGQNSTTAVAYSAGTTVELFMLHGVPLTEVNKTHTAIGNIGIDSYTVTLSTSPQISGGSTTAQNGGDKVIASENAMIDTGSTQLGHLKLPKTAIDTSIRPMTATSASGVQSSFVNTLPSNAFDIDLDQNINFDVPHMMASEVNETLENNGAKSFFMDLKLTTQSSDVSPVIDMDRASFIAVGNRLNKIDSSSDVYPTTDFNSSLAPEGDNNAAIYLTRKVSLENPATAFKVFFAANRHNTADIEVFFKALRSDDASAFDDLGYVAFNVAGEPDATVQPSLVKTDFQQYVYTAGVTDQGEGQALDEFIAFSIKIVLKGTNSSQPPRLKDLRCIALAM
jgi:hypothetical protein